MKRSQIVKKLFFMFLLIFSYSNSFAKTGSGQKTVFVGILEPYSNPKIVRKLFKKIFGNSSWENVDEIPALSYPFKENPILPETNWTMAFDGKNLGNIKSKYPKKYATYSDYGTQNITTKDISNPNIIKPIVLVSEPNFKDPDAWKPGSIDEKFKSKLFDLIQKKEIINCDKLDPEKITTRKFKIKKADLIFSKAYKSTKGLIITGVNLREDLYTCDFIREDAWLENWYLIRKDGAIEVLGTDLIPIDAGDYDGDGKSEFIFSIDDGDNRHGYRMFYNKFSDHVDFAWNNH